MEQHVKEISKILCFVFSFFRISDCRRLSYMRLLGEEML